MNIKYFAFYKKYNIKHSPTCFSSQTRRQRNESLFIYNNYINFIHTWGNFDWPIKVTPSAIKVTSSAIKVTPFDGVTLISLWFRISSKKLIITYGKGIELKAKYHIVLHSVAGACGMYHIFKTFKKPSKSIKVILSHGITKLLKSWCQQ